MKNHHESFLETANKKWEKLDWFITLVVLVGLSLNAWGIVMNGLVVEMNSGVMPVITEQTLMITTNYGTPRQFMTEGNLLLLGDHIRIDFPNIERFIPSGGVRKAIYWWAHWLDYPIDGGLYLVSIGDICRWIGTLLFLLGNILLTLCIARRLYTA